jgi:phage terminase large subunit-like protein
LSNATKNEIREAAESDLYKFIQLVAPHRVLGQCHKDVIKWWEREDALDCQMVLFPRDHQKSALAAYRVAWRITKQPDITILYISSTSTLAEKQLGFIKDILNSPVYRRYWPEMTHPEEGKRKKWTEKEIMVDHPKRAAEGVRDATVVTAGLTTQITGLHCNIAVLDDVVVKENAYTTDGRNKVAQQYSLLSSIETTGAEEWIVGTRYHPKDLYGELIQIKEDVYDVDGNITDSRPVYETLQKVVEDLGDGTGNFLWPRQQRGDGKYFGFNTAILARKRAKYLDKTQFHAQYYNNPNDPGEEDIPSDTFQCYNPDYLKREDGKWCYNGRPLNVFASIDFAFSLGNRADYTAVAVIGVDSEGNVYILDLKRERTNKVKRYYELVFELYCKWEFSKLAAEVTAAQDVIVEKLKDDIRADGLRLSIDKFRPNRMMGAKEERIHNTLAPYYENNSVWHYPGGVCEILEQELVMRSPPNDDVKDALHMAFRIMKVPMARKHSRTKSNIVTHSRFGGVASHG